MLIFFDDDIKMWYLHFTLCKQQKETQLPWFLIGEIW